jgi:hypothetical protein
MKNPGDKIRKIKERMFYVSAVKWHDTVTLEIWGRENRTYKTNVAHRRET